MLLIRNDELVAILEETSASVTPRTISSSRITEPPVATELRSWLISDCPVVIVWLAFGLGDRDRGEISLDATRERLELLALALDAAPAA